MDNYILPRKQAITVFLVFAFGYFLSCLLRAITATLSPILTSEFQLTAADLGLLAGVYFLGFACMQIPLGYLLDKFGPKKDNIVIFINSICWNNFICTCSKFFKLTSF